MRASEIVNKLKDVLLSSTEVEKVEESTIENKVDLKEDDLSKTKKVESKKVANEATKETPKQEDDIRQVSYSAEEVLAEDPMEDTQEEIVEEKSPQYATIEEVAEIKAMVEKLRGMVEATYETSPDVPQELSSDQKDVEMTEPLAHSPENEVSEKLGVRYATNANTNTTYSRVLNAISNN